MYTEVFANGINENEFISIKTDGDDVNITVGDVTNAPATTCVLSLEEWRLLLKQLSLMTFPPRSSYRDYDD